MSTSTGSESPLRGRTVVVANWRDLDHSLAGGAERYAWEFAKALVDAGARVEFLTARERGQSRQDERDGVQIRRGGSRLGYYAYAAAYLARHRRRIDAVVDAEAGIPVFSPLWVGDRAAVSLLMHHVHQEQFATYFPAPVARLGRFLEGRVMPRVYRRAHTIAVSESTHTELITQLGWTGTVDVLVNGNHSPRELAVHPADTVDRIAVLGRLATHKRVDLVILAVAALAVTRPTLHLDVIGAGPELDTLRALVEDLGAEKHVTLHGFVEEDTKAELLSRARLHVCASDAEGWGQVVIEAASYGVPTLARNVPGLRGSIRPTTTGWLLDEAGGDAGAELGAVLSRLTVGIDSALTELDDPERRDELGGACRAWAAQFSWERMHAGAVALVQSSMTHQPGAHRARPTDRNVTNNTTNHHPSAVRVAGEQKGAI